MSTVVIPLLLHTYNVKPFNFGALREINNTLNRVNKDNSFSGWLLNIYNASFKFVTNCAANVKLSSRLIIFPIIDKDNFDGWYTDNRLSEKFYDDGSERTNLTLYAKWGNYIKRCAVNATFVVDSNTTSKIYNFGDDIDLFSMGSDMQYSVRWFSNENFTNEFIPSEIQWDDFTLYGRRESKRRVVTLFSLSGYGGDEDSYPVTSEGVGELIGSKDVCLDEAFEEKYDSEDEVDEPKVLFC